MFLTLCFSAIGLFAGTAFGVSWSVSRGLAFFFASLAAVLVWALHEREPKTAAAAVAAFVIGLIIVFLVLRHLRAKS
jgi:hypothetical protein